jgi:hypothetical protein
MLQAASFIQTSIETCFKSYHYLRRSYLLPWAHSGGRDMIYLTSGAWTDYSDEITPDKIQFVYDSKNKRIRLLTEDDQARTVRWPWLSATNDGRDLSHFFADLRISRSCTVETPVVLMLFVHQNGWIPTGTLSVVLRDGSDEEIPMPF